MTYRSWLITGGAGSFGQQFVRFLLNQPEPPDRIVILSRDEFKHAQMAEAFCDARLRFFLGDVRDHDRLCTAMHGVDVVVHAAALKRVDRIAYNPTEAKRTNVDGTENVCSAAIRSGVQRVVMISSDKSCQNTTSYGASKAMGEWITVGANVYGYPRGTRLACVRYGNVLGSRGSILQLFRDLAAANQSATDQHLEVLSLVPITDPGMTRFWITFGEASQLVLEAVEEMKGGEIFIPKLSATRVIDLAELLLPGVPHRIIGLRAGGEKIHEVMICEEEASRVRDHGSYFVISPDPHHWTEHEWGGARVPAGFRYSSDRAPRLLKSELAELVNGVAAC